MLNIRAKLQTLVMVASLPVVAAFAEQPTIVKISANGGPAAYAAGVRSVFNAYGTAYPEITFVHLSSAEDVAGVDVLISALGAGAENVDYQHPPEARDTLLEAQGQRIRIMLNERLPSSTLFRTGIGASLDTPYACVVTLDIAVFTGGPMAATRFFFEDLNDGPDIRIDNADFLQFALDHEVFHCLDAYINGPTRPQTDSEVMATYFDFRAEQRAELYAALMHRARNTRTNLLKDLASIRTMALVNWDLQHYTAPVLRDALNTKRSTIVHLGFRERVRFAMDRADKTVMNPEQFKDFILAAVDVSLLRGEGEGVASPVHSELLRENREVDEKAVQQLLNEVRIAQLKFASSRLTRN